MKASERQRQNIVTATMVLVETRGIASISLSDIAAEAGISRQTVYNHFSDTSAVFEAALDMHGTAMVSHVGALMEKASDAREKIVSLARFMIEAADPAHETLPLEAGLSLEARERLNRHTEALRDLIAGVLKGAGVAARADMIWTMIEASSHTAARHPEAKPELLSILITALDAAS
jgi:AcrR family transcriptional regulator